MNTTYHGETTAKYLGINLDNKMTWAITERTNLPRTEIIHTYNE